MSDDHDPIAALGDLAVHDVGGIEAARIGGEVRRTFEQRHSDHGMAETLRSQLQRFYDQALEPAMVAALVLLYLGWAFSEAIAVHASAL